MTTGQERGISIEGKTIGGDNPCYLIAEIGLNHNGDPGLAKELVDVAAEAGADAFKLQKRTVDTLAVGSVLDAADDRFPAFGRTYREIREHMEFTKKEYEDIIAHAEGKGITFLCTAFDTDAADFLMELGVPAIKLASHSVTNLPLLSHVGSLGKPVIMSSGMCTLGEFDQAVEAVSANGAPLALMHCVSSYPQAVEESNLRMMSRLRERYHVPVGYSGHELGALPTLAAVAMGAELVERHITTDKTLAGFDHKLSLEPHELKQMVRDIRAIESARGEGKKAVSDREMVTRKKYHVSIVAKTAIPRGTAITPEMLTLKNPGTGMPASMMSSVVGSRARTDIPEDVLVEPQMLEGSR